MAIPTMATNRHTVAFVMVGHQRRVTEDVVARLDLFERTLVNRGAPNRYIVDDLHKVLRYRIIQRGAGRAH